MALLDPAQIEERDRRRLKQLEHQVDSDFKASRFFNKKKRWNVLWIKHEINTRTQGGTWLLCFRWHMHCLAVFPSVRLYNSLSIFAWDYCISVTEFLPQKNVPFSLYRALAGLCAFSFSLHCYKEEKSDIYSFPLHEPLVFYLLYWHLPNLCGTLTVCVCVLVSLARCEKVSV